MLALTLLLAAADAVAFSGRAHVVDGDTLVVGPERVRLSGIDAPELSQRCSSAAGQVACGERAAAWLRERVEGRVVDCVQVDLDRYGRRVAVCRLQGSDLGGELVDAGWATAYRRYSLSYVDREQAARAAGRGLWSMRFEAPADYRRERRAATEQPPPSAACAIKGNVSAGGERIYHLHGSRAYADVRIDVARGERWFCSEREAVAAGWRPVRGS